MINFHLISWRFAIFKFNIEEGCSNNRKTPKQANTLPKSHTLPDSPKAFLNDATGAHEIRTFSDSQDYDTKSLKEMNVFDMLKSETRKPYFHLLQRLDKTDCNDPDDEPFFPDDEQIAREILDHEDQIDLMDDIVSVELFSFIVALYYYSFIVAL